MDPKKDDGYLHAQGTGAKLTVRLDADPKGGTFGLMFQFNITGPDTTTRRRATTKTDDADDDPCAGSQQVPCLRIPPCSKGFAVAGPFHKNCAAGLQPPVQATAARVCYGVDGLHIRSNGTVPRSVCVDDYLE